MFMRLCRGSLESKKGGIDVGRNVYILKSSEKMFVR